MHLFEVRAEIPAIATEEAEGVLLELGEAGWTILEDAVACRAWIVGIFASEDQARDQWARLWPSLPVSPLGEPAWRPVADADWKESYKAHFHAWKFGRLNWVPVWEREDFRLPEGEAVLWLDPGMAFGTGNHETTRLVVERLMARATVRARADRVIDAGCGSGILALSASKLGFSRVTAFDCDPQAVEIARENAALNGLSDAAEFFVADLSSGLAGKQAELIMANIQADVLIQFASELTKVVAPGGELVLSGILIREIDHVRGQFAPLVAGWSVQSRAMGEWTDLVLTRPA